MTTVASSLRLPRVAGIVKDKINIRYMNLRADRNSIWAVQGNFNTP